VLSVTSAGYYPLYRSYPALTYVVTYRSDAALPLAGGGAFAEHTKAEQERVRSPLALGWVGYYQVLACESVGNVTNMTRLGDRTRVQAEKQ